MSVAQHPLWCSQVQAGLLAGVTGDTEVGLGCPQVFGITGGDRGNQGVSWGSCLLMGLDQAWESQSWDFFLLFLCAFLHSWGE